MKTIWKFPLRTRGEQDIALPYGARVLTVQTQPEPRSLTGELAIVIWAEVDPAEERRMLHHVILVETGKPMGAAETMGYVGTVQLAGGAYVLHVYMIGTSEEAPHLA